MVNYLIASSLAIFDVSLFPSTGFAAIDYTWNLWPRLGSISGNAAISDFAPNASNASVAPVPEPNGLAGLLASVGFGALFMVARNRRILNVSEG